MGTWFWVLAAVAGCFGLGAAFGATFLPILKRDVGDAMDLANVKAGQTVIDLGSGDGRILVEAAKRGAKAIGYEINPLLWLWSLAVTWRYRKLITVHLGNFWNVTLPPTDVIYVFIIIRFTKKLDAKLRGELKQPTKVVSYVFELPAKPVKRTANTLLYRYP